MKILMPIESQQDLSKIAFSFGRSPFFLIYDTKSKTNTVVANSAARSSGGAGIKAGQIVVNNKVDALIAPRIGENAASVIREGNIKIYKAVNENVNDNIQAFLNGDLKELVDVHPGFHN